MKVTEHIEKADSTLFSFEILPPLKGRSIQSLYDSIDPLIELNPSFVNVTYHREEFVYKEMPNGLLKKISVRKRPGTVGICAAIKYKYQVDTIPHMICGGFNKDETENALIDLQFLGIDNVLALRGDPIKSEPHFKKEPGGHQYAHQLVEQINHMNNGEFLDGDNNIEPTDFCIGVAGYPEKHFESMNLNTDLQHLKEKVDNGADYIVTQMFYDNKKFFEFEKKCREIGINVPIIPGIKPIKTLNHINFLPKYFHIDLPDDLANALSKCKTNNDVKEVGIEWGIQQVKELKEFGVPCIHFYTMGKSEETKKIASTIY